jgi:hypothetical protein
MSIYKLTNMIVNECDVLCDIQCQLDCLLSKLTESNTNIDIEKFKSRVKKVNTTYFNDDKAELLKEFLTIFDDGGLIDEFKNYIAIYKNIIDDKINNICIHEWVEDYIDITPDRSQYISYCRLCEITQK